MPWVDYWYNTSFQGAAKCIMFEIVYGRPPPSLTRFIHGETDVEVVVQELMNRDEALKQLKYIFSMPKNRWYVLQTKET